MLHALLLHDQNKRRYGFFGPFRDFGPLADFWLSKITYLSRETQTPSKSVRGQLLDGFTAFEVYWNNANLRISAESHLLLM